jgi:hypothetical protein
VTAAAIKIVIVSGQEFSIPADTPDETLRQTLAPSFPEIATATIQKGTREVEGHGEVETIEFVKKAGTKGLEGRDLAALLARVPAQALPGSIRQNMPLARAFMAGTLTCEQALAHYEILSQSLQASLPVSYWEGHRVWQRIDALPAAPVTVEYGW